MEQKSCSHKHPHFKNSNFSCQGRMRDLWWANHPTSPSMMTTHKVAQIGLAQHTSWTNRHEAILGNWPLYHEREPRWFPLDLVSLPLPQPFGEVSPIWLDTLVAQPMAIVSPSLSHKTLKEHTSRKACFFWEKETIIMKRNTHTHIDAKLIIKKWLPHNQTSKLP